MKQSRSFIRNKVSLAISLATASFALSAQENHFIYNQQGAPVFEIRYFNVGDGPFLNNGEKDISSTWNLNADQKKKVQSALGYWASIIQPPPGMSPAIINVGSFNDENAGGTSENVKNDSAFTISQLQAAFLGVNPGELSFGSHGQFVLGKLDFDTTPYTPLQQPGTGKFDLTATAIHELAHGLGVLNSVENKSGATTPAFANQIGTWAQHLRDDNGNAAQPGQYVLCTGCKNDYSSNAFDVRKDQGYFTGDHVTEVLAGAMPGIPVKILDVEGGVDEDYMSHIELKNSLMSHQNYRNYTTFMEAELAVLQDLGYQIDRRNAFGYSIYGNGQTLYNQNGYFKRNETGTAYLAGAYNETPLGVGLHVYGSDNLIFQQADLLTQGAGAAGVRVDGEGNTLVVEPGTRIHANGLNGVGVLFAYGKDHDFVQRGDIEALGENGVGAKFSFGNNLLGNATEYRGSYFQFQGNRVLDTPLPELMGALVDTVNISGRLAGSAAAIQVDDSALVNQINILAGAQLEGGIHSDYNRWQGIEQRFTQLNFGLLNDGQGRALDQADPNFRMTYDGDIQGIRSLVLNLRGGETSLNSQNNQLYAVNVEEGATLRGNGQFQLNPNGEFVNRGTVAPGNSLGRITVDGDYRQTGTGQLLVEVNDKGAHDSLVVKGNADLAGRLTVAPARGWYSPQWTVSSSRLLNSTSTTGSFDTVESLPVSPTLSLLATPKADGSYLLNFERSSDAYAQYALSKNGREVGEALSETASQVKAGDTDRQKLYTALDFSEADGSTIGRALEQLSPSAYSAMVASSLQREQQVADAISAREPGKLRDDEWQAFIQPFGGNTRQNSDSHTVGFNSDSSGVIFGAETAATSDGNLIVGLHGAASKQKVNLKDPLHGDGDTTALELGVHARYAADPMAGSYMLGSARIGYETGELKRKLDFADYSAENKADWTGKSASLVGGGGYRFKLNENVSLGPIATLTYTSLWRDGTHEKGADGSTLKLKSQQFDSLRSSIGLNSAMNFPLDGGKAIKAEGQITWNHELLDTNLIQDATFANYQGVKFKSKNTVMDRDSMGLRGSVRYQISENVDIGAGVASDLFRTGYNSVSGNLSLDWRF